MVHSSNANLSSIDLAYDRVGNILRDQLRTAEILDTKASIFFTLATAIIGTGATVGIKQMVIAHVAALSAGSVAAILYLAVAVLAVSAFWIRGFNDLSDPAIILKDWVNLAPNDFKRYMLEATADVYPENQALLTRKAKLITAMMPLVVLEAVAAVASIGFGQLRI